MKIIKNMCQKFKNGKIKTNRAYNKTPFRIKDKLTIENQIKQKTI